MQIELNTQIRVVVFATVISLMMAMLLPFLAPVQSMDADTVDEIMAQRADLQDFTGASMINQAPFVLTGVYTPYIPGQSEERYSEDGALYGESIDPYIVDGKSYIGKVSNIKLDPDWKSTSMLIPDTQEITTTEQRLKAWAEDWGGYNPWWDPFGLLHGVDNWLHKDVLDEDPYETIETTKTGTVWNYSGYRYVFEPSLTVDYTDETGTTSAIDRITLSIVWYDMSGVEGLSGGLILYEGNTKRVLANISASEIIGNYDMYTNKASVYTMNFEGLPVKLAIRFDPLALDGSQNLLAAWSNGDWTLGFYAPSLSNFLDRENSMSYDLTLGSLVETYTQVFTLNYPTLSGGWDLVVWVLCSLPMLLVLIGAILAVVEAVKPF